MARADRPPADGQPTETDNFLAPSTELKAYVTAAHDMTRSIKALDKSPGLFEFVCSSCEVVSLKEAQRASIGHVGQLQTLLRDAVEDFPVELREAMRILYALEPWTKGLTNEVRREKAAELLYPGMTGSTFRDRHELAHHRGVWEELLAQSDGKRTASHIPGAFYPASIRQASDRSALVTSYMKMAEATAGFGMAAHYWRYHVLKSDLPISDPALEEMLNRAEQIIRQADKAPLSSLGVIYLASYQIWRYLQLLEYIGDFRKSGHHWVLNHAENEQTVVELVEDIEDGSPFTLTDFAPLRDMLASDGSDPIHFFEAMKTEKIGRRSIVKWLLHRDQPLSRFGRGNILGDDWLSRLALYGDILQILLLEDIADTPDLREIGRLDVALFKRAKRGESRLNLSNVPSSIVPDELRVPGRGILELSTWTDIPEDLREKVVDLMRSIGED